MLRISNLTLDSLNKGLLLVGLFRTGQKTLYNGGAPDRIFEEQIIYEVRLVPKLLVKHAKRPTGSNDHP